MNNLDCFHCGYQDFREKPITIEGITTTAWTCDQCGDQMMDSDQMDVLLRRTKGEHARKKADISDSASKEV